MPVVPPLGELPIRVLKKRSGDVPSPTASEMPLLIMETTPIAALKPKTHAPICLDHLNGQCTNKRLYCKYHHIEPFKPRFDFSQPKVDSASPTEVAPMPSSTVHREPSTSTTPYPWFVPSTYSPISGQTSSATLPEFSSDYNTEFEKFATSMLAVSHAPNSAQRRDSGESSQSAETDDSVGPLDDFAYQSDDEERYSMNVDHILLDIMRDLEIFPPGDASQ